MRFLIPFLLMLLPFSVQADLDRSIDAFNSGDFDLAKVEALEAMQSGLPTGDRLLAEEISLLSDFYAGRDDAQLLQEFLGLEQEISGYYGTLAFERLDVLEAISELQFNAGQLDLATRTYAIITKISSQSTDTSDYLFLALRNLASTQIENGDKDTGLLYSALYKFFTEDLGRDSALTMEATALLSLALFYDDQLVRAVQYFIEYSPEEWLDYAAIGPDERYLVDELDDAMASIEVNDPDTFYGDVEAARQRTVAQKSRLSAFQEMEAERLALTDELTLLQEAGDRQAYEDRLRRSDASDFVIGGDAVELMNAYLSDSEPDDPVNYIFSSAIARSYTFAGDLTNARPYLATVLSLPAEYLAVLNIPVGTLATTQAADGGLDDRVMRVLLTKARAIHDIVPNSEPSLFFDILRASGQTEERLGDFAEAERFYLMARDYQRAHDLPPVLFLLDELTSVAMSRSNTEQARIYAFEFLDTAKAASDDNGTSAALGKLALLEAQAGNYDAAIAHAETRLQFEQARVSENFEALTLAELGLLTIHIQSGGDLSDDVLALVYDFLETDDPFLEGFKSDILRTLAFKEGLSPATAKDDAFFSAISNRHQALVATLMADLFATAEDLETASQWKDLGLTLAAPGSELVTFLKVVEGRIALAEGDAVNGLLAFREVSDARLVPTVRSREGALDHLPLHIAAAYVLALDPEMGVGLRFESEMFMMAQLYAKNASGSALSASFVRAMAGTDVATLLKEREEIDRELQTLDAALDQAAYFGQQSNEMLARANGLRERHAVLSQDVARLAPEMSAMIEGNPVRLTTIGEQLRDDEVFITYVTSDLPNPYDDTPASFAIALTREHVFITSIASQSELLKLASALRCSAAITDPNCDGIGDAATRGTFGTTTNVAPTSQDIGFDASASYDAYQALLEPLEDILEGKSRVIVVPDRALTSVPFHLMMRSPLQVEQSVRDANWLIRDFSIEIAPSVSSFYYMRQRDTSAQKIEGFLGVGDPLIGAQRDGPVPIDCGPANDRPILVASAALSTQRGVQAQRVSDVIDLAELPDARCELRSVAETFAESTVLLHENATETAIKSLNASGELKGYSVISFATHGLVAGEIGVNDAALVMTPPAVATANDDGLLSSAEIANLELDAELVILSACNTASGHSQDEEGLSGLASAFFAAGAKSLIVSHWPVFSDAAVELTTRTLDSLASDPGTTRADALRFAMLSLIDDPDAPARQLHPSYWGPFMIVGDGLGL